ncbi:MAG: hypothetical protein LBT00_06140, partial [Spirochaetaceae bacterium]|nr:hypothetical protein [Spirochaetaceae bacterium]
KRKERSADFRGLTRIERGIIRENPRQSADKILKLLTVESRPHLLRQSGKLRKNPRFTKNLHFFFVKNKAKQPVTA